jgi:hypothetical protein
MNPPACMMPQDFAWRFRRIRTSQVCGSGTHRVTSLRTNVYNLVPIRGPRLNEGEPGESVGSIPEVEGG